MIDQLEPVMERVYAIQRADRGTVHAYGLGWHIGRVSDPTGRTMFGDDYAAMEHRLRDWVHEKEQLPPGAQRASDLAYMVTKGWATQEAADALSFDAVCADVINRARHLRHRLWDMWMDITANPKILLDSGGYVFGKECWWKRLDAPADTAVRQLVGGRTVVHVPPSRPLLMLTAGAAQ